MRKLKSDSFSLVPSSNPFRKKRVNREKATSIHPIKYLRAQSISIND